jgi:hypothetical protein
LQGKFDGVIQLISQLRGYFYVNPVLALSLAITIFSFVGVPPLVGFFAKQMVLSAALDSGYVFLSLVAILTSVVGAVYYLNIIKEIFFYKPEYKINNLLKTRKLLGYIYNKNDILIKNLELKYNNIVMSSPISITISCITLIILLFIFMNREWLNMGTFNLLFFLCAKEHFASNLLLLFNTNTNTNTNTNRIVSHNYLLSPPSLSTYSPLSGTHNLMAFLNGTRYINRLSSILPQQTLRYSTFDQTKTHSISPWFISGYTDAEGCFNVSIQRNPFPTLPSRREGGIVGAPPRWGGSPPGKFYIRPQFLIQVHSRDKGLLMQIQDHWGGIGNIYNKSDNSKFIVRSLDHILKIIDHFSNYPLITQKKADFILFKQIIDKIVKGEHLSAKGLEEIVNIKASLNLGLSDSFKTIFPKTVPVTRPLIENITITHPEWMAGFVSGEGCFLVEMSKYGGDKLDGVSLTFKVSQLLRDELLLRSFISFFGCGLFNYHSGKSKLGSGVFIVRKFADISNKILPFFKDHVIRGIKREDFEDWARVAELIKSKDHLTEKGVEKIREIKSGMNTLR